MEIQETLVVPGKQAKSQTVKPKHKRRTTLPPKSNDKEEAFVHKRVFGSVRNQNLEEKTIPEKPKWRTPSLKPSPITAPTKEPVYKPVPKPKLVREEPITKITPKKAEPVQITPSTRDVSQKAAHNSKYCPKEPISEPSQWSVKSVQSPPAKETHQKASPNPKSVPNKTTKPGQQVTDMLKKTASASKPKKKKNVSFPEGDSAGLKTPGLTKAKPKVSGTPYYTAKRCSKCRFDKMETSSYWLGLIKVAEDVEKHNVSAGFFNLALEAKSEPISALKVELKRYMSRHGYLSDDREWNNLTASYGLKITPKDHFEVQASENGGDCDQEPNDSYEQMAKELENNLEGRI